MDATTLLISATCLLLGMAAGSLLTGTLSPHEKKRRELEAKLQAKDDELKTYQRDVSDHFLKTSELIRDINRTQRDLSEQLATGAARLTSTETCRKVQQSALEGLEYHTKPAIIAIPQEPPKDYAPSVPGGVLNESYGLADIEEPGVIRGIQDRRVFSAIDVDVDDDPTYKIS